MKSKRLLAHGVKIMLVWAWRPITGETGKSRSWFGGAPLLPPDGEWPICPLCEEPMQFFLQLDCAEFPEEFDNPIKEGLIQVFYCSSDNLGCDDWEAFSGTHEIRISSPDSVPTDPPSDVRLLPKAIITKWEKIIDTPDPEDHEFCGITYDYDFQNEHISVHCENPEMHLENLDII